MMKLKAARRPLSISFVLFALASSNVAGAADRSAFVAPEDQALVVFIQNEPDDYMMNYIVFDPDKKCVAEVGGREAAVISLKPGKYTYYLASANNHRIDMDLHAGRTYFIRLSAVERIATSRSAVTPVQRGTDSYKLLKTWLDGTRVIVADDDPCRGKPLKERANRTQKRINEANADWKNGDKIYRYNYSLLKSDGLTALEVGWLRDR
jgi:hypothetical protein